MKKKYVKAVMGIHDNFNYSRVHEVMTLLDWKWINDIATFDVPTLESVKERGLDLLLEAAEKAIENKSTWIVSTGGFRAEAKLYKDDFLWARLSFVLEEWDNSE